MKPAPAGDALDLLGRGDLRPLGLLPRASNFTFLAEVVDGDRTALAVYKPRAGETPLWDFPPGTLCNREVGAVLLSGDELDALAGRAGAVAPAGRYPAPGPGRSHPWPAI